MNTLKQSKDFLLKKSINFWVVVSAFLMVSNVVLALLCWYSAYHQKIEITPFFGGQSYIKSDSDIDVHYLLQMSENFVAARLNVTPENIKANHERLLRYVDSRYFSAFSDALIRERTHIIGQKISTYFDVTSMTPNLSTLSVTVTGQLKRFVGLRALETKTRTYTLRYNYHLGQLALVSFEQKKGSDDE